jgi:hypothetical protein
MTCRENKSTDSHTAVEGIGIQSITNPLGEYEDNL